MQVPAGVAVGTVVGINRRSAYVVRELLDTVAAVVGKLEPAAVWRRDLGNVCIGSAGNIQNISPAVLNVEDRGLLRQRGGTRFREGPQATVLEMQIPSSVRQPARISIYGRAIKFRRSCRMLVDSIGPACPGRNSRVMNAAAIGQDQILIGVRILVAYQIDLIVVAGSHAEVARYRVSLTVDASQIDRNDIRQIRIIALVNK